MNLYKQFKQLMIDMDCIGLIQQEDNSPYFCTPNDATIIGWEGVDGIHYCMIPKFKDMVFCVSPMESCNNYVHPLATSFQDFLSLLLACGSASVLAQTFCMSTIDDFNKLSALHTPTSEQQLVLDNIAHHFDLSPMLQPYEYVKSLQQEFDYSSISFSKEYYDVIRDEPSPPPEWKVFYNDGFLGHSSKQRSGKEIPINKSFSWESDTWYVPSLYSCGKGLVIDFCVQVDPKDIEHFLTKWKPFMESNDLTVELEEQIDAEQPLKRDVDLSILLNGKNIHYDQYFSTCWNPCLEEGIENDPEAQLLCEHYQFDISYGWIFIRAHFPWATKRKVPVRTLSVILNENPKCFPGPHFSSKNKDLNFIHPRTKLEHTLLIHSCTSEQLPEDSLSCEGYEYPSHFQQLTYSIEPTLEPTSCILKDCNHGDSPKAHNVEADSFYPTSSCGVAIIGGACGPTSIFLSSSSHSTHHEHRACSSLYFKQVDNIEWRITFQETLRSEITIPLL